MSCECLPNLWFRLNVDQLSVALDCMVSVKLFCYFVCNVLSVFSNVDGSRISSIKNKDSCKRLRSNSVSHYLGNKLCKMQRSDTPIKINLKNRFKWPLLTHLFLTHSCSYHVMTLWTDVYFWCILWVPKNHCISHNSPHHAQLQSTYKKCKMTLHHVNKSHHYYSTPSHSVSGKNEFFLSWNYNKTKNNI